MHCSGIAHGLCEWMSSLDRDDGQTASEPLTPTKDITMAAVIAHDMTPALSPAPYDWLPTARRIRTLNRAIALFMYGSSSQLHVHSHWEYKHQLSQGPSHVSRADPTPKRKYQHRLKSCKGRKSSSGRLPLDMLILG